MRELPQYLAYPSLRLVAIKLTFLNFHQFCIYLSKIKIGGVLKMVFHGEFEGWVVKAEKFKNLKILKI